uniref:SAP domain-containing ribonucleoprotein n=1 Tax=Buteo japonicus TaxID=224669 RepID=A0A8C0BCC8_9AVES
MAAETVELHKLKLAELKQECLARGLEAKGNKQDLINRLQAYLEEHGGCLVEQGGLLEEEPKPVEPPVKVEEPPVKSPDVTSFLYPSNFCFSSVGSFLSLLQRMQKRAERFNVPVSLESKKAARAAREDLSGHVNMDKLKERAQRFGLNVSSLSKKSEEDEKLKKRKERFGIVTSSAGAGATEDTEVKPFSKQMGSSRGC